MLVTGCSSGIGLETALVLGWAEHSVYATMRKPELDQILRGTIDRENLPVSVLALDVPSDEAVAATVAIVRSKAGFVGALVNNAGIERCSAVRILGDVVILVREESEITVEVKT